MSRTTEKGPKRAKKTTQEKKDDRKTTRETHGMISGLVKGNPGDSQSCITEEKENRSDGRAGNKQKSHYHRKQERLRGLISTAT